MSNIVVAITGASGAAYAVRLLEVLLAAGRKVDLTISPSGAAVLSEELALKVDLQSFAPQQLLGSTLPSPGDSALGTMKQSSETSFDTSSIFSDADATPGKLFYHHYQDFNAGIASGSRLTAGMVICPCSMGTLAAVSQGLSQNLIHRAADVHLKERRKLIVVPRETPLGSIQLENMKRLADAGAVVLPAMPGFYHGPLTIHDLIDFVVARILDQLGVPHNLCKRWGDKEA